MSKVLKVIGVLIILAIIIGIIYYALNNNSNQTDANIEEEEQVVVESESELMEENTTEETGRTLLTEEEVGEEVEVTGTDEEKAIALAKNQWGPGDDSVYYSVVGQENGNYIVSVNRSDTTQAVVWYEINVESGEVSDY